jgi:hypothetical protein
VSGRSNSQQIPRVDRPGLEVGGDTAFFPIAVASRVRTIATADFRLALFLRSFAGTAALLGLGESALGGGRYWTLFVSGHASILGLVVTEHVLHIAFLGTEKAELRQR